MARTYKATTWYQACRTSHEPTSRHGMSAVMSNSAFCVQNLSQRIMEEVLRRWTIRVADLKFRELETVRKYEKALVLCVLSQ